MAAPCDLNVLMVQGRYPEKALLSAVKLGYRILAVNQVATLPEKKKKQKGSPKGVSESTVTPAKPSDRFLAKLKAIRPDVQLFSRLTVPLVGGSDVLRTLSTEVQDFDLVAVQPRDNKALMNACKDIDVDIISLDCVDKPTLTLKREVFKMARRRNIAFEFCYGPAIANSTVRQNTIIVAQQLLIPSKGKNIILSSGHENSNFVRGPYDVTNLAVLLGMTTPVAKDTVTGNCRDVLNRSASRNSVKSAMDIRAIMQNRETEPDKRTASDNSDQTPPVKRFKQRHQ